MTPESSEEKGSGWTGPVIMAALPFLLLVAFYLVDRLVR
jgi:hypothetical protein